MENAVAVRDRKETEGGEMSKLKNNKPIKLSIKTHSVYKILYGTNKILLPSGECDTV